MPKVKIRLQLNTIRAKLFEEVAHSSEGYPMPALFPFGSGGLSFLKARFPHGHGSEGHGYFSFKNQLETSQSQE